MLQKLTYNVAIAADAIRQNRLRALLTSLGIVFGVASVIAMLAIGRGAEQQILQQIRILGADNVIVQPVLEEAAGESGEQAENEEGRPASRPYSPGLTLADAESIRRTVPGVAAVSPEVVIETHAMRAGQRQRARLVGVTEAHFAGGRVAFKEGGAFTPIQIQDARPVAIIGQAVENRLFPRSQAIGQQIKCGALWLTVVGVLEERALSQDNIDKLGLRDYNFDVYTPITTTLRRVENRARVTRRDLQAAARDRSENDDDANVSQAPSNYHQLDRLVVRADSPELVAPVAEVVGRMLKRRHNDVEDVQVLVPEQLLAQEQRTQTIFNLVLAAIASISLIVGGIGIMNIMLASVLERIREIGLRRAVGATERDIVVQFLIEALTISLGGGLLGIGLGLGISAVIEALTGIPTLVSGTSIAVSFVVSAGVGLVFGLLPARRAAERDPVEALRYE